DFAMARLNPADGSLDTTFGGGIKGAGSGLWNLTFGSGLFGGAEFATSVALQPDGKIVVGGYTDAGGAAGNANNLAVARVNPDGSLDTDFGTGGKQTVDFRADDRANGLALQPDGKIVLAGSTQSTAEAAFA